MNKLIYKEIIDKKQHKTNFSSKTLNPLINIMLKA